jgi:hypothetical protein
MYSRKEHAERLVSTFGFDCAACRAAILRETNAPDIGVVYVGQRDHGLYKIGATTSSPIAHLRELSQATRREHTLVHTIAVLDSRALENHLHRRLDAFLDDRRQWYALSPAVLDAVCAENHFCDVPPSYLLGPTTNSAFYRYLSGIDSAIGAGAS